MHLSRSLPFLIFLLSLTNCTKEEQKIRILPTISVWTQEISIQSYQGTEEVLGTIQAGLRATIEAKINGRIDKMYVAPGQVVTQGQVLVELEAKEIQAKLQQAVALRDQAEQDLRRYSSLVGQGAVTRQEYDATQARERVAKAAVLEGETMLGYSRVTAPYDGLITRKLADVGDLATPGKPLLDIEDPSALRVEAYIPEGLIALVSVEQKMNVTVNSTIIEGTVSEISPSSDPNSRTFLVKIDLPQSQGLRTGQFTRVEVPTGERKMIVIPQQAMIQKGQMEIVFVANNNKAEMRLVKTGKSFTGQIQILSGLAPGDKIIVKGAEQLSDQQNIKIEQ